MILGVDTGTRALGWARYDETRNAFIDLGVSILERDEDEKVNLDRVQRCAAQTRLIRDKVRGCSTIVVEALSFPRNAGAAVCIGLSWGSIVGLAMSLDPEPKLVTIAPQRWQVEVLGRKAEYEEIVEVATMHLRTRHPTAFVALQRIPERHREHAIDAAMMALCAGLRIERCDELAELDTLTFGNVCRHGEPRGSGSCSQCRRDAIVRKVTYDTQRRVLLTDGKDPRNVDPGIDEKYRERARRGNRKSSKNRRVTV